MWKIDEYYKNNNIQIIIKQKRTDIENKQSKIMNI